MPEFPYRMTGPQAVAAVASTVRSDPAFVAGCLVAGGAHGYSMELEYVQRSDGTTRYRVWNDVQCTTSIEDRAFGFDFAAALEQLRTEVGVETRLPPREGSGRYALVVLANRDGGTWIEAPTPGRGQPAADGPLGRIFGLVFPS